MKRFLIVLVVCVLYSCSTKKQEKNMDLIPLLTQALSDSLKGDDKNLLCLFISDNMCSACIEKEFLNIKSANIPVALIGIFEKKRNFSSSANQLSWTNVIFIQREEKHSAIVPRIFYFIYNSKEKTCSEIFYPESCEEERTFAYFRKIKSSINTIHILP